MAKLHDLQKYLNYVFSSGSVAGEDYRSFERKYINYLKTLCNENGWEFVKASKMHYEFSAFLKVAGQYVYLAIDDVRYWINNWYNCILIRMAKDDRDYHGDRNNYTDLPSLVDSINRLVGIQN